VVLNAQQKQAAQALKKQEVGTLMSNVLCLYHKPSYCTAEHAAMLLLLPLLPLLPLRQALQCRG
jgi:hypothetical protein